MRLSLTTFLVLVLCTLAHAQSTEYFNTRGVAIRGYDPVAYFTDSAAVKGSPKLAWRWAGTDWYFSTQENMDAFRAAPEKFAPQYGGFCAYGVSEDHKSPTEPEAFTIVDGKLYLNYNMKVKSVWTKDIPGHIKKADINWVELKSKQ